MPADQIANPGSLGCSFFTMDSYHSLDSWTINECLDDFLLQNQGLATNLMNDTNFRSLFESVTPKQLPFATSTSFVSLE